MIYISKDRELNDLKASLICCPLPESSGALLPPCNMGVSGCDEGMLSYGFSVI